MSVEVLLVLNVRVVNFVAKRTRLVLGLMVCIALRNAVLMLYPALCPCWIKLVWRSCNLCAASIVVRVLLLVSFLAMTVRSSSAWAMVVSKNKLSALARSRRVLRICALRRCLLVFCVGGATVLSSSSCGGSGLSCLKMKAVLRSSNVLGVF